MDVGGDSGGNRGSPMKIERFEMERYQSTWENTVEFNLADSGVHPITLAALVDHSWIREVLAREQLGYGHTNGSEELRTTIAGLYHAAGPEHVLVTSGTAEANFLITWVVADEVYRGAELDGHPTSSFWGRYPKVIVTGGLSKAYGLPGLRIGWIVAPHDTVQVLWSYHDYTTIAPSVLSDHLARVALGPRAFQRLGTRTRLILNENLEAVARWVDGLGGLVSWIAPRAGAIAFLRYQPRVNSTELATRLRKAHDVLVVPGDHFQLDGHIRI